MGNNKFIEYTERNDDLGMAQVVQGMAVRELSDLELVIISDKNLSFPRTKSTQLDIYNVEEGGDVFPQDYVFCHL